MLGCRILEVLSMKSMMIMIARYTNMLKELSLNKGRGGIALPHIADVYLLHHFPARVNAERKSSFHQLCVFVALVSHKPRSSKAAGSKTLHADVVANNRPLCLHCRRGAGRERLCVMERCTMSANCLFIRTAYLIASATGASTARMFSLSSPA